MSEKRERPCEIADVIVKQIFLNTIRLLEKECNSNKIVCSYTVIPDHLQFSGDTNLVEQIIINLMKNSIEAIAGKENGMIKLKGYRNTDGRICIQVIDNGKGIPEELIEEIFIPFFTTKKKGSGIGLSLSRQIMRLHGGNIIVHSEPGIETVFTLKF